MKVILDSCFILECVKNKIDLNNLKSFGILMVPNEVLDEIKFISEDKRQKGKNKEIARISLELLNLIEDDIEFFDLGEEVDNGLCVFSKKIKDNKNEILTVATTDKGLITRLKPFARILTVKGKDKIDFV